MTGSHLHHWIVRCFIRLLSGLSSFDRALVFGLGSFDRALVFGLSSFDTVLVFGLSSFDRAYCLHIQPYCFHTFCMSSIEVIHNYVIWTDNGSMLPEANIWRQEGKYPMIKVLQAYIRKLLYVIITFSQFKEVMDNNRFLEKID